MIILWTSPHCRPDWLERLGEESQGGQTEVMFKQTRKLVVQNPTLFIDIYTRYQSNDYQIDKNNSQFIGNELLHDSEHGIHAKELENGKIRIIRLPAGPTDRYILKERLYGKFIDEFVAGIINFSKGSEVRYKLAHGHYADGWETVTKLSTKLKEQNVELPTILTTHSLGKRKREDCLKRGEGSVGELDNKYNFSTRILSEEKSLEHANRICTLSTTEKEYLENNYESVAIADPRLVVTPNGIDPKDFKAATSTDIKTLEKQLGLTDNFVLLVPSRVDPRKGQLNLLKALSTLGYSFLESRNIKVLFVAWPQNNTSYSDILDKYIEENQLESYVVRVPPIPHEQMPVYFGVADLVIIPSQEYFSIAMIEAMLLQKAVIASKEGGSRDALIHGESGYLVDHTNIEQLAEAVNHLSGISDDQRKQMGIAARKRITHNYTLEEITKKIENVYASFFVDSNVKEL